MNRYFFKFIHIFLFFSLFIPFAFAPPKFPKDKGKGGKWSDNPGKPDSPDNPGKGNGKGNGNGNQKKSEFRLVNENNDPCPLPLTQGDASGTISFYLEQNKGDSINLVRFFLPSGYIITPESDAPTGWHFELNPDSLGDRVIDFYTVSSSYYLGKKSIKFTIGVGKVPSSSSDQTDQLVKLQAWENDGDESDLISNLSDFSWKRHGLFCEFFIDPPSLAVNGEINADFVLRVQNRTTSVQSVSPVKPEKISGSFWQKIFSGDFQFVSGPNPSAPFTLQPSEVVEFSAEYKPVKNGAVRYTSGAFSGSSVTSKECISNEVIIGDVGGWMEVPLAAANNEIIPIAFHVANNTDHPITNLEPKSLSYRSKGDLNTPQYISGPNPPGPVPSLSPGAEITFYWQYRLSGSPGAQYLFSGRVVSDEEDTRRDQSDWGTLQPFSVNLDPTVVTAGDQNITFSFDVHNGGDSRVMVDKVTIMHPDDIFAKTSNPVHFIKTSPQGGYSRPWSITSTPAGDGVVFSSSKDSLPGGENMFLSLSYNVPDKSWYPFETHLAFLVMLEGSLNQNKVQGAVTLGFHLIHRSLSVSVSPVPPVDEPYLDADGNSRLIVSAKMVEGESPMSGKNIHFTANIVETGLEVPIAPEISPLMATTDAQGIASTTLTAPRYETVNPSDVHVKVTAQYLNLDSVYLPYIAYSYYDLPTLKLQSIEARQNGSTWKPVNEIGFMPGDRARFRPKVMLISAKGVHIKRYVTRRRDGNWVTEYTTLRFSDEDNGGTSVYEARLSSDYNNISSGESVELVFENETIASGFIYGHYSPVMTIQYVTAAGKVAKEPYILTVDDATHKIRIGSKNKGIQIINWREKLEPWG